MIELWKTIDGYNGRYKISSYGNVYSYYGRGYKMKQRKDRHGYPRITLTFYKSMKTFFIHQLVAKYFIENINNYNEINHIDGNKENNSVDNLEWCTHEENMDHRFNVLYRNNRQFINTMTGKRYKSLKEFSFDTSIPYSTLCQALREDRANKYNIQITEP